MKIMSGFYAFCAIGRRAGTAQCRRRMYRHPRIVKLSERNKTMWTKPEFTEMRFGFEVTMYIANR
jgi:coenzyme PQQ precursor peptide PqqA